MARIEVQGEWWLPATPDHKVAGTLLIDDDNIELSLFGALSHELEEAAKTTNPDGSEAYTFTEESIARDGVYSRIVGIGNNSEYTLEDCFQVRRTGLFFGGTQTQRIHVHQAFKAVHFEQGEALEFSRIVVKMTGLSMFVQRTGLREELIEEKVPDQPSRYSRTASATSLADEEFDGLGGSKCTLRHVCGFGGTQFVEQHLTEDFSISAQFDEPQPLQTLLSTASHLQSLVSIATGRRAVFTSISLRHPDVSQDRGDKPSLLIPIEMHATWTVKPEAGKKPLRPHEVSFTLDDFGGVDAITRWLQVVEKYASSLQRVMISRYSDRTYASDNLLNSAAALEGYDRDKHGKKSGEEGWLVNRFRRCIEQAGDVFIDIVADTDTFAVQLKKQRDAIAHHSNGVEGSTAQLFLGRAAAWLLIICLLRDADAPEAVFDKIKATADWRWLKGHVAAVLAEVGS